MKKLLLLLSGISICQQISAQSLTSANNVPMLGDLFTYSDCDSGAAIPRNTGHNQHWDFSDIVINDVSYERYVSPSSVPQSSLFPGTTLVAKDSGFYYSYTFFKLTTTTPIQFQVLGSIESAPSTAPFTFYDPLVFLQYPLSYGGTFHDSFSAAQNSPDYTDNESGTSTVTVVGTGTLILPDGISYPNVIQVKRVSDQTEMVTDALEHVNYVTHEITYEYYDPEKHLPLLSVYFDDEMAQDQVSQQFTHETFYGISMSNILVTGIQNRNFDSSYDLYPNPAKDNFLIKLSNPSNEPGRIEIYSSTGQIVRTADLGKSSAIDQHISLSGLSAGVYLVKTSLGARQSSKRLVIE